MPLTSMTGFAETRGAFGELHWRWELRSVNGRGLDLRLRMPGGYEGLEGSARKLAAERFKRGSLQAALTVATDDTVRGFRVDAVALADAVRIAKRISEETGLAPARVDGLLALKGVVVQEDGAALDDEARLARDAALLDSLANGFDLLAAARIREGAKIEVLVSAQIDELEARTNAARVLGSDRSQVLYDKMKSQLAKLLDPGINVPEDRVAQEIALLAARADVCEELDRLGAHCQEARALIAGGSSVGRKLDFLAQEFNREANTLCAKSSEIALTREGLALKTVIDQFREQIQNIE